MEVDSLNTASTFVKCALDRSLSPSHPIPSRLARTQLQPISRKREQNNSYRGANARAGTRAKGTRVTHQEGIAKRERGKEKNMGEKDKRERDRKRERERERDQDGPLSSATPGRCPLSALSLSPFPLPLLRVDPILEARQALAPYLARAAGEIFKFCHVQV